MSTDPRQARQGTPWQSIITGSGFYGRGQVPQDQMRISDAERQQVADVLSKHYAEGRLDQSEFDERASRAMGAKTRGDLRGLLDDLPPTAPAGGPVPMGPPPRPRTHRILLLCAVVFLAVSAAAAVSAPWHFPWVLFLVLGFFLFRGPLRRHGWPHHHHHHGPYGPYGYGPPPPPSSF